MLATNRTTTLLTFLAASICGALASPAQASVDQSVSPIDFAHAPADHTTPITLHTTITDSHGIPVPNAVLFTNLGGNAISDDEGRARITLNIPPQTPNLHLTAASSHNGQNHTGTRTICLTEHWQNHQPSRTPINAGIITMQAGGECEPQWMPGFAAPGVNGTVYDFAIFDDGTGRGPALYVGGTFTIAGGMTVTSIVRWDGTAWSSLGSGVSGGSVVALSVFDDGFGGGPALYAGGNFTTAGGVPANSIAKWDGTSWSSLGSGVGGAVVALTIFDDGLGGGPALYAGGTFQTAGGEAANRIAKWDGAEWSALNSGVNSEVWVLTVFDDGTGAGPALYAGGSFMIAGGVPVNRIARWDGTVWSPLDVGMNDEVGALTVFDDGSGDGPALYAGGAFTMAGGVPANRIAKWDGTAWTSLGSGMNDWVLVLTVNDNSGGGPALYAGGIFTTADGVTVNRTARWDGTAWTPLGSGTDNPVRAFIVFDDGSGDGPALYAGGGFTTAGESTGNRIAKWSGTEWSSPGQGSGMNGAALAFAVFDDGTGDGPALYAGGQFATAGDVLASRIAKWDGTAWSPLGSGMSGGVFGTSVTARTVFDDGSGGGPALYAGGDFTIAGGVTVNRIARWDGSVWSALGSGMSHSSSAWVGALAVFDDGFGDGPALYAGGLFTAAGDVAANYIAKWDGTSWSSLGSGMDSVVRALTVFDSGSGGGPALYAGGLFTTAGKVTVNRVARWDGIAWSPVGLGSGMDAGIWALTTFDDGFGSGPALYAGGGFSTVDGLTVNRIARWDGIAWSPLGSGVGSSYHSVRALTVFDDGSGGGPELYAGGYFTTAGGMNANNIAKWDGTAWSPLGSGIGGEVTALAVYDEGSGGGPALYAGGLISTAGGLPSSRIAVWQGCAVTTAPCPADLNGDGTVGVVDLFAVLAAWGACEDCPEDLTGDGVVDNADVLLLLDAWGVCF